MKKSITISELTYFPDLPAIYRHFSTLPGFVLLQSGQSLKGRYDILTAFPWHTVKASSQENDWVEALEGLINDQKDSVDWPDLPFVGGAMGYLSYDYGAAQYSLISPALPGLEQVPAVYFGLYDWAIVVDHLQKKVFLVGAMTQSDTAAILAEMAQLWDSPPPEPLAYRTDKFEPL